MNALSVVNPFFAAHRRPFASARQDDRPQVVYARLPFAPRNPSPVPHLTSLYHFHRPASTATANGRATAAHLIKDL